MQCYGKYTVDAAHINHRDISLVAVNDNKVVGFLYVGLMAKNTVGYMDKFTIHPDYANQGIGQQLAVKALEESVKRGVREVFGIIQQDQYHDKSAMNALRMAIGSNGTPYTYVRADINFILSELGGASWEVQAKMPRT